MQQLTAMMKRTKREKRKAGRVTHQVLCYLQEKENYYLTKDLSERGCRLAMKDPPSPGTGLTLLLHLPGQKPIQVKGVVKHTKADAVGVEFVDMGFFGRIYTSFLRGLRTLKETKELYDAVKEATSSQRKLRIKEIGTKVASAIRIANAVLIIFFLGSAILGIGKHYMLKRHRNSVAQVFAQQRNTTVITMVHRQETVGLLGIPVKQYIQVEDAESVLRAIRTVPDDKPIDFIVHTPGGLLFSAYQIARALKQHKGKVTVFIPHYAMSGGTLIALAADEIVMDKDAILGPVDPQLVSKNQGLPAVSLLNIPKVKSWRDIEDSTVIMIDQARKSLEQVRYMVKALLEGKVAPEAIKRIVKRLTGGEVTHDYPIFPDEAKSLGLPVTTDMPQLVYKLMALYPQPGSKSTSRAG